MGKSKHFRWIVLISVLFTYLLISTIRTSPGIITDQLMTDFQVSAATIGLVTGIQFFIYTTLQVPMGLLADRYGPNFFLIIGAMITGIGTIIFSIGTNELILFCSRILMGMGDATIWVNLVLILGRWFPANEFTRLIGVAGMTGSLGFLLGTAPFSYLIYYFGWRLSFLFTGGFIFVLGLFLYYVLVMKPKHTLIQKNKKNEEKIHYLLKRIFTNRNAWALFFCHFGIVGGYIGFIGSWAVPLGMDVYGLSRGSASQIVMASLIGALVGAPLISYFSSIVGKLKGIYIFFYVVNLSSWATLLLFKPFPHFYLFYMLLLMIGFSFGANSLTFAAVRKIFPPHEAGIASGFANTGGFLSAVLLPAIYGGVLDYFQGTVDSIVGGYYYGFIVPVVFALFGFIGVCSIKETEQELKKMQ